MQLIILNGIGASNNFGNVSIYIILIGFFFLCVLCGNYSEYEMEISVYICHLSNKASTKIKRNGKDRIINKIEMKRNRTSTATTAK